MKIIFKTIVYPFAVFFFLTVVQGCAGGTVHTDKKQEEAGTETQEHRQDVPRTATATLSAEQIKAVGITLGRIERKELTATITANGMLRVPNNSKANATVLYGGVIKSIEVQIGDVVKKGQVVAVVSNPQFITLQEEYASLGSRITLAEQEMQRQTQLNEGNAGIKKNLQSATAELSSLLSRKVSLSEQLQLMGLNPDRTGTGHIQSSLVVTAPIGGTVSDIFAKIGSYIDVANPIAEIVDNSSLHLDLQVFEKDLPLMKVGQVVHFTLTNNPTSEYDAKVFSIGSSFENESKTIAVHCKVVGNKQGLIGGMNITGIVSLNNVVGPAVADGAIAEDDGRYYIFVLTEEKAAGIPVEPQHKEEKMHFERIEVIKGVSNMGYTAVTPLKDIAGAARIVTKGAFFVNAKLGGPEGHEH
ncbi:efflux RND transporter periplasmic adaptor subunit [Pedobacter sp. JY14-1]|uniref:efflux RND transporter periplasmic adaptor subunit n=1 Tax=Pedobacter sp. JY14-1 TaxID=3034151 RepID=UPI0023E2C56D|nr:efflux RND transporter periplasmic adaptor subunit [Pedobacter sp. JY14-1]